MQQPLSIQDLARGAWIDYLRSWRVLVVYQMLFKLLEVWLLIPAVAAVMAALMRHSGHIAISNQEILQFLLSPVGIIYAVLLASGSVALLLLEQAGIMALVALASSGRRPPMGLILLKGLLLVVLRVARLGTTKVVLLALTFVPFLLLAALTWMLLLTEYDIYYYWKERPPVFWVAIAIGGVLATGATTIGMWLFVRWSFALPILMFENLRAPAALLASRNRTHGIRWRIGLVLLGWIIAGVLVGLALLAGYRTLANLVMGQPTQFPVIRILLLLILQGAILGAISFVTVVGQGLLTRRLYLDRNHELGLPCRKVWDSAPPSAAIDSIWVRRFVLLLLAVVVVAPVALWADLPQYLQEPEPVKITAHRGHSTAAPENTLAALQAAIDSGADFAEIDAQLTADGKVVVFHDRDLRRLARDSRPLAEVTLEELQEIDVGSWFDPKFADQRVPTLQQAIDLCYGKIKLNIELKYYGANPDVTPLAEATTEVIRRNGFEDQCIVTSLRYPACEEVRRIKPNFRTGLIVTHALGDISRLDVDALVVRADFLSERLLLSARRLDREVHVWNLNDPRQIRRFINRGVDNIMTSDPDMAIRTRDEWIKMDATERAIVAARVLLGLRN